MSFPSHRKKLRIAAISVDFFGLTAKPSLYSETMSAARLDSATKIGTLYFAARDTTPLEL